MRRALAVSILLLAGCGGSERDAPPIEDPAVFIAELPTVECEHQVRCGVFAAVEQCLAYRAQAGVERLRQVSTPYDERYLYAIERGTVTYAPDEAGRCLEEVRRRSCSRFEIVSGACHRALTGEVANGRAASWSFECASGWSDTPDDGCSLGSACCTARCDEGPWELRDRALGESCGFGYLPCRRGLTCGAESTCVRGPAVGEACSVLFECRGDAVCHLGRCVDWRDLGNACTRPSAGVVGLCSDLASTCTDDDTCRRAASAGEACDESTLCAIGLRCDAETGRCVGFGGEGAICFDHGETNPVHAACSPGFYCSNSGDTSVCRPTLADGAACFTDAQCQNGRCDSIAKVCRSALECP